MCIYVCVYKNVSVVEVVVVAVIVDVVAIAIVAVAVAVALSCCLGDGIAWSSVCFLQADIR